MMRKVPGHCSLRKKSLSNVRVLVKNFLMLQTYYITNSSDIMKLTPLLSRAHALSPECKFDSLAPYWTGISPRPSLQDRLKINFSLEKWFLVYLTGSWRQWCRCCGDVWDISANKYKHLTLDIQIHNHEKVLMKLTNFLLSAVLC